MTVRYGKISLSVCDYHRYMKCMNTVVYLVHFWQKNMAYLDSNFDGTDAVLMRNSWHYFVHITWGAISNMGWPHITPVCLGSHSQEPWGDGDWDWLHRRRRPTRTSQWRGFTGGRSGIVQNWWSQGVWRAEVPKLGPGAKPINWSKMWN